MTVNVLKKIPNRKRFFSLDVKSIYFYNNFITFTRSDDSKK